jgi:hypothetical protein
MAALSEADFASAVLREIERYLKRRDELRNFD